MNAFYAVGGGWGHFTRIKSFIEQQGIKGPKKIIVSNPQATASFSEEELVIIPEKYQSNSGKLRQFVYEFASQYAIRTWYIDTFPSGVLGELTADIFRDAEVNLLARRLKWDKYFPLLRELVDYDKTYQFEELEPSHQAYLQKHGGMVVPLTLSFPVTNTLLSHPVLDTDNPIWLVVHTSSAEELQLLIDHAMDLALIHAQNPSIVILSDLKIDLPYGCTLLSVQNPQHWYGLSDKIFSAAGFNTWYELAPYRDKHICLPFRRKYDDQFWRSRLV